MDRLDTASQGAATRSLFRGNQAWSPIPGSHRGCLYQVKVMPRRITRTGKPGTGGVLVDGQRSRGHKTEA